MHLILRFATGRRADALLLSMTDDAIRVVLHDKNETVEFSRAADRWIGDDGSRMSIEAVLSAAPVLAVRPLALGAS